MGGGGGGAAKVVKKIMHSEPKIKLHKVKVEKIILTQMRDRKTNEL